MLDKVVSQVSEIADIPDFDISAIEKLADAYFYGSQFTGQGAAMGKIGMFPFFMHHNEFKRITETLTANFGSYKPIKGQEILSDSGGFGRQFTMNGILVAEPIHALKPLDYLLMMRKPVRFTTLEHDFDVVMTNLSKTKEYFTIHGTHRVQSYNISMKEVYGSLL